MSENNDRAIDRRTVLKSIGTTSAAGAGIAASSGSVTATEITNDKKYEYISNALEDPLVQKLFNQYSFLSYENIERDESTVSEIKVGDDVSQLVQIPYNDQNSAVALSKIIWTSEDNESARVLRVHEERREIEEESPQEKEKVEVYFPSESGEENVLRFSVTEGEKIIGEKESDLPIVSTESDSELQTHSVNPIPPARACPFDEPLFNLSCAYEYAEENKDVGVPCTGCAHVARTGHKAAAIAFCGWCAIYLIAGNAETPSCDLCTDDPDKAASGLPEIDPEDIPDADDLPSEPPGVDDLPGLPDIPTP